MGRAIALAALLLVTGCATGPEPQGPTSREELSNQFEEGELSAADAASRSKPPPYVDRFGGKLYVVLLDDKTHGSIHAGRSLWALTCELAYTPSDGADVITVPRGFVTDLASIPRPFWDLLPPDGPWTKAAVVHDYLYYTAGTGIWRSHPKSITRDHPYTRAEADWILRDAMRDRGVDGFRSEVIYLAVRVGGGPGWRDKTPDDRPPAPPHLSSGKAGPACPTR